MDIVKDEPERRRRLWENQRYFVESMAGLPYRLVSTATPIVPVLIGDEVLTGRLSDLLQAEGLHVDSVKFPAVAKNRGRLRVILNAGHTREQIDRLVAVFRVRAIAPSCHEFEDFSAERIGSGGQHPRGLDTALA